MIKVTILITFVLLVISLFRGLFIVYNDRGEGNRGFYALVIRVSLAVALMAQVGWGIATGQVGSRAPWDKFEAVNAPPIKPERESKAPEIRDPIKEQALKDAREEYLKSQAQRDANNN